MLIVFVKDKIRYEKLFLIYTILIFYAYLHSKCIFQKSIL